MIKHLTLYKKSRFRHINLKLLNSWFGQLLRENVTNSMSKPIFQHFLTRFEFPAHFHDKTPNFVQKVKIPSHKPKTTQLLVWTTFKGKRFKFRVKTHFPTFLGKNRVPSSFS